MVVVVHMEMDACRALTAEVFHQEQREDIPDTSTRTPSLQHLRRLPTGSAA
jgi:hypothetical protein